jgi:hypothetical protein
MSFSISALNISIFLGLPLLLRNVSLISINFSSFFSSIFTSGKLSGSQPSLISVKLLKFNNLILGLDFPYCLR